MSGALALELFGYLGSFMVLVSMLMTSVVRLRVINLIGSAIFATYAILIRSYPTALLNGCLVCVNLYHLLKLRRTVSRSYVIQSLGAGEGFADWFVGKYRQDIERYFPDLTAELAESSEGWAVFFDDQAAGLLLGRRDGDHFDAVLDYASPAFRDCSVGAYLYVQLPALGVTRLSCPGGSPEHTRYLEKMGFSPQADGRYVRELTAEASVKQY